MVFEDLASTNYPGTALHSLRLSRHVRAATSEADFVVVNNRGVLVIEVKGGGIGRDESGTFLQTGRNGTKRLTPGPFEQAEQAMFSLRERLVDLLPNGETHDLAFGWAVAFPQCRFGVESVEWEPVQVYDQDRRRNGMTSWLDAVQHSWLDRLDRRPAPPHSVDAVIAAMRPIFHRIPTLAAQAEDADRECVELTSDQWEKLRIIERSPRILCTGGAGTGKTFIAAEVARQHLSAGERVAVVVPSEILASYIGAQPGLSDGIVTTLTSRPDRVEPVDVLIVDEAQDLLDWDGLNALSSWVEGGIEGGRWRIFLDPNTQAGLVGRFDRGVFDYLEESGAVVAELRTNCRNTKQVVENVYYLTGADIGVPTFAAGPGVTIAEVADRDSAADALNLHLRSLREDGIKDGAITILSPVPRDRSCIAALPPRVQQRVHTMSPETAAKWPPETITFSSPLDFKGLENTFICLVDLTEVDTDAHAVAEVYVAMTRARASLWIAVDAAVAEQVAAAVRRRIVERGEESG
jgi:hypothetical protein